MLIGASAFPQHLLLGEGEFEYHDPAGWLVGTGRPGADATVARVEPEEQRELLLTRLERFVARMRAGATPAWPAQIPPSFASWGR